MFDVRCALLTVFKKHLTAFRVGLDILLGPAIVVEASPAANYQNSIAVRCKLFPQVGESAECAVHFSSMSTFASDSVFQPCRLHRSINIPGGRVCNTRLGDGIDPISPHHCGITSRHAKIHLATACIYLISSYFILISGDPRETNASLSSGNNAKSCMFLSLVQGPTKSATKGLPSLGDSTGSRPASACRTFTRRLNQNPLQDVPNKPFSVGSHFPWRMSSSQF